ncbi:5-oxoprolinase subunit B family protein [Vibrio astriarenae]|uniref:5-oxoprolinase subunit B family protein n=1 Tax=Vibrio astriarenae TaxID=1481923 RepID=UPI00373689C4
MNKKQIEFDWHLVSETAILFQFQLEPCRELSQLIGEVAHAIAVELSDAIMNVTPSHNTLLIDYLPYRVNEAYIVSTVHKHLSQLKVTPEPFETIIVPAYYSPETGLDLAIYEEQGMSLKEVEQCHTEPTYYVSALGFAPGFAFLVGLNQELMLPRLTTPRVHVPKGSVAVADQFSAVYPSDSPGGWNVIARSPLSLFNLASTPHTLFSVGASVRFKPISKRAYLDFAEH